MHTRNKCYQAKQTLHHKNLTVSYWLLETRCKDGVCVYNNVNTCYISKNMKTFLVSGNILSGSLKTRFKDSDLD